MIVRDMLSVTLISVVTICIILQVNASPRLINHRQTISTTPSVSDEPLDKISARGVTVQHIANYNVSFVPLVKVILNMIPKLINRIVQPQQNNNRVQKSREMANIPAEFSGTNPCIDSILTTKQYPGSMCHYYKCVLHQPTSVKCLLEAIEESTIDDQSSSSSSVNSNRKQLNAAASSYLTSVKISECLTIKIYKCTLGHKFDTQSRNCIRNTDYFDKVNICGI